VRLWRGGVECGGVVEGFSERGNDWGEEKYKLHNLSLSLWTETTNSRQSYTYIHTHWFNVMKK
jgi:hypothetical protein